MHDGIFSQHLKFGKKDLSQGPPPSNNAGLNRENGGGPHFEPTVRYFSLPLFLALNFAWKNMTVELSELSFEVTLNYKNCHIYR